jgi:hypothetical protein
MLESLADKLEQFFKTFFSIETEHLAPREKVYLVQEGVADS